MAYPTPASRPRVVTTLGSADKAPAGGLKIDAGFDQCDADTANLYKLLNGVAPVIFVPAAGDAGVTDDAVAINAVIASAKALGFGGTIQLANSKYYLKTSITIPFWAGFKIVGLSREGTILNMVTDNTPIFIFTGNLTNDWEMGSFKLQWSNNQPSTNTLAVGFYFNTGSSSHSIFNWHVHDIVFLNGYRCFSTPASNAPLIWGVTIDFFKVPAALMSGAFFWAAASTSGQPHIRICNGNINGYSTTAVDPLISINNGDSVLLDSIELLSGIYTASVPQLSFSTCGQVTIIAVKSENATVGNNTKLWSFPNSEVVCIGVEAIGCTVSSGTANFIQCQATALGKLSVSGLNVGGLTNPLYGLAVFGTAAAALLTVEEVFLGGTAVLIAPGTLAPRLYVDALTIDATTFDHTTTGTVTLSMASTRTRIFDTALTGNLTVNLPSSGYLDGAEFVIVLENASPGAFTLTVTDPTSGNSQVIASGSNGVQRWRATSTTRWDCTGLAGGTYA